MSDHPEPFPARSFLFVPGDRPDFLAKAEARGADSLILDLEDAIASIEKHSARLTTANWLKGGGHSLPIWVRVNRGKEQGEDLRLLQDTPIEGVMLPKVEDPAEISAALAHLTETAKAIVIIETAKALRMIDSIAGSEGVHQLMIGEADLGADLGLEPGHPAWDSLRIDLVAASIAAGIHPPIASVNPSFSDAVALERETRHFRDMGYASRPAIHPAQIDPIHRAFRPTEHEVEEARRLLALHEAATANRAGAHSHDGRMIDEAFVRRARWIIAAVERA